MLSTACRSRMCPGATDLMKTEEADMDIEMLIIVLLIGFVLGIMVGVALAKPNIVS
jgi:hypothetical protein